MAYKSEGTLLTFKANGALEKNRFVILNTTAWEVKAPGAATDNVIGVTELQAASGQSVTVQIDNVVKVEAGGIIAVGGKVTTTTAGKALAATTGAKVFGLALEASWADGDVISVLLYKEGVTLA